MSTGSSQPENQYSVKYGPYLRLKLPNTVSYGPRGCVSTHRSEEGHCIVATACEKIDILDYELGLVCVDTVGSPVKHLFGKGSFNPVETFDTQIKCKECLGLESIPDGIALSGEVDAMARELRGLSAAAENISSDVTKLNQEVFEQVAPRSNIKPVYSEGPGPAPAPAGTASPAPAEAKDIDLQNGEIAAGFLSHRRHARRHHLRHAGRHHLRHAARRQHHHHRHPPHHHRYHNNGAESYADHSSDHADARHTSGVQAISTSTDLSNEGDIEKALHIAQSLF
jgi:hypothetical protein